MFDYFHSQFIVAFSGSFNRNTYKMVPKTTEAVKMEEDSEAPFSKRSRQLREDLEKEEIEAQNCRPSNEVYAKLLAIYLFENNLCSAKFLWKRMPEEARTQHAELNLIWNVGKAMWKENLTEVFQLIDATQWSENVSAIMKEVKSSVRQKSLELVSRAYSSISVENFSKYVGVNEKEAVQIASNEPGWLLKEDEQLIYPAERKQDEDAPAQSEKQLASLTDFVSFLEK